MTRKYLLTGGIVLLIALTWTIPALADGPDAAAWLKTQQNADGGFGTPESTPGATADTLLAVAATGQDATGWAKEGKAPLDYLQANVPSKTGDMAKTVLALIAAGKNPRDLGGVDLVARLEGLIGSDGKIGGEADFVNEHCYALIALSSAKRAVPAASVTYLLERQIEDGTWSWNGDTSEGSGDNNTAAMAVIALVAAGVPTDNEQIQKTLVHLKAQQDQDGGFPYIKPSPYGTDSDSNSTAVVMWAIIAAGQDPAGASWKYQGQDGHSALDRLRAFQNESGAFRWQDSMSDDNFASSVQATIALELKTLPFSRMDVGEAASAAPTVPQVLPETGANLWVSAIALLVAGVATAGVGLFFRSRS